MEKHLTEEQIARIEEAKLRTIARNNAEIEAAWKAQGMEAPRLPDGRPISIELHRMISGRPSQAAE